MCGETLQLSPAVEAMSTVSLKLLEGSFRRLGGGGTHARVTGEETWTPTSLVLYGTVIKFCESAALPKILDCSPSCCLLHIWNGDMFLLLPPVLSQ